MLTLNQIKPVLEKIINKTNTDYIKIIPTPNEELTIFDSKFGGVPYLNKNTNVPIDKNGSQLALLAQIDCATLPENNIYPKSGLLQFWIGRDSGSGLGDKDGSKVIYYKDLDTTVTEDEVLEKYYRLNEDNKTEFSPYHPKNTSFSLTFEKQTMPITSTCELFERLLLKETKEYYPDVEGEDIYAIFDEDAIDYIFDELNGEEHIIGGYPSFIQWDPRYFEDDDDFEEGSKVYSTLLLQIGSEWGNADWPSNERYEIMWGDAGIANFFIAPGDLEQQNFDDVLYNWDCS